MGAFLRSDRPSVTASAAPSIGRRAVSAPYGADRTILAAAEQIDLLDPKDRVAARQRPYAEWQREAWEGYEHVGEVHYGFNLLANLLSRARLYAGQIGQANEAPVDLTAQADKGRRRVSAQLAKVASAVVNDLLTNGGTDLIRNYALNMSVPGECHLIHMPKKDGTKFWTIRSCDELEPLGDGWRLNPMRNTASEMVTLPKETFVARIWRMNPRYSREPDSSMIGVRNPIKTLLMLERLMRTSIRSRLNAGILFVPDTITSSLAANQTASELPIEEPGSIEDLAKAALQDDGGQLVRDMIETFSAPITDETNAASLVPMLLKGPQDAGEKIKHILLTRPSDDWLMSRAEHALERVLNGIDIPKEVVTGLQQVKYCASEDTEIMTRGGWRRYTDLTIGDEVLTLNRDTELTEWQPVQAVNVFDCVDEPMLSIEQRGHSSLTTMNHRWHVRRQTTKDGQATYDRQTVTSGDLAVRSNLFVPVAARHVGEPTEAKYTDAFVELIGWWFTEGHLRDPGPSRLDCCVDREAWKSFLTNSRRTTGLSRRAVIQRMGQHIDNPAAASAHMIHIEQTGGVRREERIRLAEALDVKAVDLEKFFRPGKRAMTGFIFQSLRVNPEHCDRIRDVLTAVCSGHGASNGLARQRNGDAWWTESMQLSSGVVKFTLSDALVNRIQEVCPGPEKVTLNSFVQDLTHAQRILFITTALNADGYVRSTQDAHITQVVPERLDALELACVLAGLGVHRYTIDRSPYGERPAHVLKIKKRQWTHPTADSRSEVPYTGKVWCPTTENQTWLARRGGTVYYTMNSNAVVIDENLYKSNIEPLALALVDSLTSVYLRPKLIAMGFPPEEVAQLVIWYDPSDIVTRPNSADDATEGLDRGLLNPTAWRREHGFAETDAPTDEDLMQTMLGKAQMLPEQVVLAMAKKVFGDKLDLEEFAKQSAPPAGGESAADVLRFGRAKNPPADPQRTAVQQVGVR